MLKAIFHVDELIKWELTISNVKNLIKEIKGTSFNIIVLANSQAVKKYTDFNKYEDLGEIVSFKACNNALKAFNMDKNDIPSFVTVVPAGVLELIVKQNEGFSYIKP